MSFCFGTDGGAVGCLDCPWESFPTAAKEEACEESIRLKNQFRALDDDEVEFLDSVLESSRAKEAALRKETAEQLDAFRKQQQAIEKATTQDAQDIGTESEVPKGHKPQGQWSLPPRKRRRDHEQVPTTRLKLQKEASKSDRVDSHASEKIPTSSLGSPSLASTQAQPIDQADQPGKSEPLKASIPPLLGLDNYDSDDD